GWNHGNEFGYESILRDPANRKNLISLPTNDLMSAWAWNHARNQLQDELGESKFVPLTIFLLIDGRPATAAVWPDGIPIAVPLVNYFIVVRKELAPKRFFQRVEDQTLVSQERVLPIFRRFGTPRSDGTLVLNYLDPPPEIRAFVEALPKSEHQISGFAADDVL